MSVGEYEHLVERLLKRAKPSTTGCLVWQGYTTPHGYGRVLWKGKVRNAHRLMFEAVSEHPIPPGLVVMHVCDNPSCLNVAHLRLGTVAENNGDMIAKGRGRNSPLRGENHPFSKLTESDVRMIRNSPKSSRVLGRELGVGSASIRAIRCRIHWAHVP